ncbi:MAG: hypothetical protein ACJARX_001749 [Psychroserpens sp.]|jgi:hypothetical protein
MDLNTLFIVSYTVHRIILRQLNVCFKKKNATLCIKSIPQLINS